MSREMGPPQELVSDPRVSRETLARLERYAELLRQWQARINLISPSTLDALWSRHVIDSLQLVHLKPEARRWLDLGSGGGLPGLIIGCVMAEYPGARVELVESNAKKCAFLRHVAADLGLPVVVHNKRIEEAMATLDVPEVITARALASLDALLSFSNLLLKRGAVGLFPKGREHQDELTEAARNWHFRSVLHPSVTDERSRIIEVSMV